MTTEFQQEREEPGVPITKLRRTLELGNLGDGAVRKRVASTCWRWEIVMWDQKTLLLVGTKTVIVWGSRDAFTSRWKRSDLTWATNSDLAQTTHLHTHKHTRGLLLTSCPSVNWNWTCTDLKSFEIVPKKSPKRQENLTWNTHSAPLA